MRKCRMNECEIICLFAVCRGSSSNRTQHIRPYTSVLNKCHMVVEVDLVILVFNRTHYNLILGLLRTHLHPSQHNLLSFHLKLPYFSSSLSRAHLNFSFLIFSCELVSHTAATVLSRLCLYSHLFHTYLL